MSSVTTTEANMRAVVEELSSHDARLPVVMRPHLLCALGQSDAEPSHFESLVRSVVSQQLSVKAADTIYGRLRALVRNEMTPEGQQHA